VTEKIYSGFDWTDYYRTDLLLYKNRFPMYSTVTGNALSQKLKGTV
jgi:hypothetical protein